MNLTHEVFRKYTFWGIVGAGLGLAIHLFLVWLDSQMIDKPIFINLEESFWQSAFSFPFLPILILEMFFSILTILLWVKLRKALRKAHSTDIEKVNYDATVKTLQETMSLLAEHITTNNNNILKKIEFRRKQGQQTSETIEEASKNIAAILRIMTEISYVEPYLSKSSVNQNDLLKELERRLNELDSKLK